jgi:hypothetical protein
MSSYLIDPAPGTPDLDAELERILAKTDAEIRAEGIAEYGSEEAWLEAMALIRDRMLGEVERLLCVKT